MHLWQSLRFGARALGLQAVSRGPVNLVEQKQRKRLQRLVAHAREHSPYLKEKYRSVDPERFALSDLPTMTKSEMMEHFDRWLTVDDVEQADLERFLGASDNIGKLYREKYAVGHTSGSEGRPLLLVKSPCNFDLLFALQAARGNHAALSLGELIRKFKEPVRLAAVTMQPGFYPSSTAFDYAPEGVRRYIEVLQISLTDHDLVDRLHGFRPTHLTAYASILQEIVRHVEAGELDLKPELEQVVNMAERLLPAARNYCADVLGAPILDDYGMGECLFLTNGCLESGGMHVNADWAILEVVDEANRPVPNGQRGEKVLLTNLANRIQPFIRYEVGDVVMMADEPCGCGSNMPLIDHIDGRSSSILKLQLDGDSKLLHPAIIDDAIAEIPDVREFQIVQQRPDRLRIRVEPIAKGTLDLSRISATLQERLADHGFQSLGLDVEKADRLAPDPNEGKFKRVKVEEERASARSTTGSP